MVNAPASVRLLFVAAGWFPGRDVAVRFYGNESLRSYGLASELLKTFGGLRIGKCGPGRDCATSDIEFTTHPSLDDRVSVIDLEVPGDDLFPLGVAHRRHIELFLDARGRLQGYGVPDGSLNIIGVTFSEGVERLLLGHSWPV